jgi:hypothetical protein
MGDRTRDQAKDDRARDNQAYVRDLLAKRQPRLAAFLRALARQVDQDLADDPCDRRRVMNAAWLYHLDSSACIDRWSCQEQDHTSIPPLCDAQAADQPAGCELPKGHPGPHLHFADLECCGAGDGPGTISDTVRREYPAVLAL